MQLLDPFADAAPQEGFQSALPSSSSLHDSFMLFLGDDSVSADESDCSCDSVETPPYVPLYLREGLGGAAALYFYAPEDEALEELNSPGRGPVGCADDSHRNGLDAEAKSSRRGCQMKAEKRPKTTKKAKLKIVAKKLPAKKAVKKMRTKTKHPAANKKTEPKNFANKPPTKKVARKVTASLTRKTASKKEAARTSRL
jgi:hypothetical protein